MNREKNYEQINNPEMQAHVIESQKAILDDLVELRPKHLFTEARFEDTCVMDIKNTALFRCAVREIFEGYRPNHPLTPLQSEVLLEHSAEWVYFSLHSDVILHATTNKETGERLDAYVSANSALWLSGAEMTEDDKRNIFVEREQLAIDLVQKFLKSQEVNEPVALIYGAGHQFDQVFTAEFNPQVYRKDYTSNIQFCKESDTDLFNSDLSPTAWNQKILEWPNAVHYRLQRGLQEDLEHVLALYPANHEARKRLGLI